MPLLTDNRNLLDAFRRGEKGALLEVYEHYAPALGDFFYRLGVRSPMDVDDLVHDTFLKAFTEQARSSYDGIKPYKNYLLTIGRNVLFDQQRRKKPVCVEPIALDERLDERELKDLPHSSVHQTLEQKELKALLTLHLAKLSPEDQSLIHLRFSERLSQREAAERLGLTRQSLRTREARLRTALFQALSKSGYVDFVPEAWRLARAEQVASLLLTAALCGDHLCEQSAIIFERLGG